VRRYRKSARAPLRCRVDNAARRQCRSIELGGHLGNRKVERSHPIGKTSADRELAAIDRGHPTHGLAGQAAIGGDKPAQLRVEIVDVRLDRSSRALGQRFVAIGVDLAIPCVNAKVHARPAFASAPLSSM
jgi:hypothetical protein